MKGLPAPSTRTLTIAMALVPFEYLYGIATSNVGAIVAGNILAPILAGLLAAKLIGSGEKGAGAALMVLAVAKALLIATTPSPALHYAVDTGILALAALPGARRSRIAGMGLLMVLAGAGLVALVPLDPGFAVPGLVLEIAGLIAAGEGWARGRV